MSRYPSNRRLYNPPNASFLIFTPWVKPKSKSTKAKGLYEFTSHFSRALNYKRDLDFNSYLRVGSESDGYSFIGLMCCRWNHISLSFEAVPINFCCDNIGSPPPGFSHRLSDILRGPISNASEVKGYHSEEIFDLYGYILKIKEAVGAEGLVVLTNPDTFGKNISFKIRMRHLKSKLCFHRIVRVRDLQFSSLQGDLVKQFGYLGDMVKVVKDLNDSPLGELIRRFTIAQDISIGYLNLWNRFIVYSRRNDIQLYDNEDIELFTKARQLWMKTPNNSYNSYNKSAKKCIQGVKFDASSAFTFLGIHFRGHEDLKNLISFLKTCGYYDDVVDSLSEFILFNS
jgi:hypothetical protein